MAILFHGKCVQKHVPDPNVPQDSIEPAPLLASNSIHSIGSSETISKSPSKRGSLLSARKRFFYLFYLKLIIKFICYKLSFYIFLYIFCRSTPRISPTTSLQPGDRLLPIGSVIGAELCLRQDMLSFKTVVVSYIDIDIDIFNLYL